MHQYMVVGFSRISNLRESKRIHFSNQILEVKSYHVCHIVLVKSEPTFKGNILHRGHIAGGGDYGGSC